MGARAAVACVLVTWAGGQAAGGGEASAATALLSVSTEEASRSAFGPERHGNDAQKEMLFQAGAPLNRFSCGASTADEPAEVAIRRLVLSRSLANNPGLLEQMRNAVVGGATDTVEPDVAVSDAVVEVLPIGDPAGIRGDVLAARLDPVLPPGTRLDIPSDEEPPTLDILYDCYKTGAAIVRLNFQVFEGNASSKVCLEWTKQCSDGWGGLLVAEGETHVAEDGVVDEAWRTRMANQGTDQMTTQLQLRARPGSLLRLQAPTVQSSDKFLGVELKGLWYGQESDVEIGEEGITITVLYTCHDDGAADVTFSLRKAVLSNKHTPDTLVLKWKKICGLTRYRYLEVVMVSPLYKNRTTAITEGDVQEPFRLPCRPEEASSEVGGDPSTSALAGNFSRPSRSGGCSVGGPTCEVAASEKRSTLEVSLGGDVDMEAPSLQPKPDIFCADRRICRASIVGKKAKSHRAKTGGRSLTVKYVCLKEGVTNVMVTLHVLAHLPTDMAWVKRCEAPKTHASKAMTAPQALGMLYVLVAIIGGCLFYLCAVRGSDKEDFPSTNVAHGDKRRDARGASLGERHPGEIDQLVGQDGTGGEVELGNRVGMPNGNPRIMGKEQINEGVTFH